MEERRRDFQWRWWRGPGLGSGGMEGQLLRMAQVAVLLVMAAALVPQVDASTNLPPPCDR